MEKKKRGRPPKLSRGSDHFAETKKNKHGESKSMAVNLQSSIDTLWY